MSRVPKAAAVAMNATFRIPRKQARDTAFAASGFAAMAIVGVVIAYFGPPPPAGRWLAALVLGGFWLALAALAVWMLLACLRHRLIVSDERIESIGVIRRKTLSVSEIASAKWRCWPAGGSLVLRTKWMRLAIGLGNYEPEERRQLIRFFRESVPPPLQLGWELFYIRRVKRECESARRSQKTEPGEGEVLLTRRRIDSYFLAGTLLSIPVAIYLFYVTNEPRSWLAVLAFLGIWAYFRLWFPRKGSVSTRLSAIPGGRSFVWILLATFVGMACCGPMKTMLPQAETPFMIVFPTVMFTWMFIVIWRVDRDQRRKEREAADTERASGRLVPEELLTPWSQS